MSKIFTVNYAPGDPLPECSSTHRDNVHTIDDPFNSSDNQFIRLHISTNVSSNELGSKLFQKSILVLDLKGRLELITGCDVSSMKIELFDDKGIFIREIDDDYKTLGTYVWCNDCRIHVTDKIKKVGHFDVEDVEKFEMSDSDYSKKSDTVRSFLRRNKLGKYNAEEQARISAEKEAAKLEEEEKANSIKVGERCEVRGTTAGTQRGEVMFVGSTHFKEGWWIGVKYDEPAGKNDGSIDGKRYFDATAKYGVFVRPASVTVGDFPELSDDVDEM